MAMTSMTPPTVNQSAQGVTYRTQGVNHHHFVLSSNFRVISEAHRKGNIRQEIYVSYLLNVGFDSDVQVWSFHRRPEVSVSRAPSHAIPDVTLHVTEP